MLIPNELRIQNQHLKYDDCNDYQKVIYRQIAQQLEKVQNWEKLPKNKETNLAKREDIGVLKYLIARFDEYKDINAISLNSNFYKKEP